VRRDGLLDFDVHQAHDLPGAFGDQEGGVRRVDDAAELDDVLAGSVRDAVLVGKEPGVDGVELSDQDPHALGVAERGRPWRRDSRGRRKLRARIHCASPWGGRATGGDRRSLLGEGSCVRRRAGGAPEILRSQLRLLSASRRPAGCSRE
jgi:hypothetical protein